MFFNSISDKAEAVHTVTHPEYGHAIAPEINIPVVFISKGGETTLKGIILKTERFIMTVKYVCGNEETPMQEADLVIADWNVYRDSSSD